MRRTGECGADAVLVIEGDRVLVPSTDYRDLRKAAYQHYSISTTHTTIRLPPSLEIYSGSILGVARSRPRHAARRPGRHRLAAATRPGVPTTA